MHESGQGIAVDPLAEGQVLQVEQFAGRVELPAAMRVIVVEPTEILCRDDALAVDVRGAGRFFWVIFLEHARRVQEFAHRNIRTSLGLQSVDHRVQPVERP